MQFTFLFCLSELALRVVAVLADDQHGIDRQLVAAAPQCLGDRRVNLEAKFFRTLSTQVAGGLLIDIRRDHIEWRTMPSAPMTILLRGYFTPPMSSVAIESPPLPELSVVLSAILSAYHVCAATAAGWFCDIAQN